MSTEIRNALTIDVEDYFQVAALAANFPRESWEAIPCRVERNVDRILALLAEREVLATFFTLGWIAERHPQLVRRIVGGGHELASHGYDHSRIGTLTPAAFHDDIVRAKKQLEDLSGQAVLGYRAPSFSISRGTPWAHDVIAGAGYRYSSSVYPVKHDHYGIHDAPRFPYPCASGFDGSGSVTPLIEIPITTVRCFGRNWPTGGGGYFRFFPYAISRGLIARVNRIDQKSAIFYFHPWEIDPDQPRVKDAPLKSRFRHYVNLNHTEARLKRLLHDFQWGRVRDVFQDALR
jgi:polysaccharide deacetylase family protein (PEP-CTERM system associated)